MNQGENRRKGFWNLHLHYKFAVVLYTAKGNREVPGALKNERSINMKNLVVAVALFAAGTLFAAPCGEACKGAKEGPKAACECKSGKPCKCGPECKCPPKGDKCKCKSGKPCKCGPECKCPPKGDKCKCKSGKPCKCGPECKCPPKGDKCKCDKAAGERRGPGEGRHGRRGPKFKKCDCSPNCPGVIILPPDSEEGEPLFKLFGGKGRPGEGMGRGRGRRHCKCGKGPDCDCPRPPRRNKPESKPE